MQVLEARSPMTLRKAIKNVPELAGGAINAGALQPCLRP